LNTLAVIYGKPARLFITKPPVPAFNEHGAAPYTVPEASAEAYDESPPRPVAEQQTAVCHLKYVVDPILSS